MKNICMPIDNFQTMTVEVELKKQASATSP
jgi:hypothetical protein